MSISLKNCPLDKRLFEIWRQMHYRCENPKHIHYKNYGGRGITVCEEWNSFVYFSAWAISNGYLDNLTLDRKENDKGYSPDNCRWVTMKEQANNTRRSIPVYVNGVPKSFSVRQRNKKWEYRIEVDGTTTRKQLTKCGFSTRDEAIFAAEQTIRTGIVCPPKKN